MSDSEYSEDAYNDSDLELQEAHSKGLIKPGLNIESVVEKKKYTNNIEDLKEKLSEFELKLDWIQRLDLVNKLAPLAPELEHKLQQDELNHEAKISKLKNSKKKKKKIIIDTEDPALNEFRRETLFLRQAQGAVLAGIPKLHTLGIKTKRPDDYFAEMAKSDQHMQKVRENLMRKQHGQERSERAKQQRQLRKIGKKVQIEAKLKQISEKRELMQEVKKYRKGLRKDLDFLDDKKKQKPSAVQGKNKHPGDKRAEAKRKFRDQKFGFGGKKRGLKKNTKESFNEVSQRVGGRRGGGGGGGHKQQRPGKNRRIKMKSRTKSKKR